MYADVIIEYPIKTLDKVFTYIIPEELSGSLLVGMEVVVPFNTSLIHGIVLNIKDEKPSNELKNIIRIENPHIILSKELLLLGKYMKEKTLSNLITCYQTMRPKALKIKNKDKNYDKYKTYIKYIGNEKSKEEFLTDHKRAYKAIEILNRLEIEKLEKKEISDSILKLLLNYKLVTIIEEKIDRITIESNTQKEYKLNNEQQIAYQSVNLDNHDVYLLEGVTGSGKTEVYMHLIKDVIDKGKSAIVLVPEICLTTQTVKKFYDRFGSDVAVFHSSLSDGEKYDEYLKIYNRKVNIVVGTRSSIFVPFDNLGLIIMDEEQTDSYKQENNPRYSTLDMAIFRGKYNNCPVILSSATPSLESRARAIKGVYKHLHLTKRALALELPSCELIDMNQEAKNGNLIISERLDEEIKKTLNDKHQAILLLNRRGFSTFISCSSCGFTYKCPNCDISLTYHKTANNLRCHYCGYVIKKDDLCPNCHANSLTYLGTGTEKVEELLKSMYPESRIVRMDLDTTSTKNSYQNILNDFSNNKYDILLGTQMISKGLDFPNVSLVGIINADTSLNVPDFRANERTFDLLYQTSGRAGRSGIKSKVLIQTYNVDNNILNFVKNNDYNGFYNYEMDIRHKLQYPPYTYLINITIKSSEYEEASKGIIQVKNYLQKRLNKSTQIIGPAPAALFKVKNIYHFNLIVKYKRDENISNVLTEINNIFSSNKKISVDITFNPIHF